MKKREKANFRIVNLLVPGTKIRAIYADEDNDPSWYDAVINSVEVRYGRQATASIWSFQYDGCYVSVSCRFGLLA